MASKAELAIKLAADTRQLQRALDRAKKRTTAFARNIKKLGGIMAGAFSAYAVINFAKTIIRKNVEFEKSMADVRAITGASSEEFKRLEEDAKRLGQTTEWTASQVATLQKEFAKLGFNTSEILNATQSTLDLATAVGADLARSAEVAGNVLRAFGLDAKETSRVTDVMADSFTSSALDLERFSDTLQLFDCCRTVYITGGQQGLFLHSTA